MSNSRNTRMPPETALRNALPRRPRARTRPSGRPTKMERPAMAPSRTVCEVDMTPLERGLHDECEGDLNGRSRSLGAPPRASHAVPRASRGAARPGRPTGGPVLEPTAAESDLIAVSPPSHRGSGPHRRLTVGT